MAAPPRRSGRLIRAPVSANDEFRSDNDASDHYMDNPESAADTDAFSASEEVKPRTKKRVAKDAPPIPKVRRRTTMRRKSKKEDAPPTASAANKPKRLPPGTPSLGDLRLKPSKDTPLLNRWIELRGKLEVIKSVQPTKVLVSNLKPLSRMPDMPLRDFKYKIESANLDINWDPSPGEEPGASKYNQIDQTAAFAKWSKTITTWRIFVRNHALPLADQKDYRLFPEFRASITKKYSRFMTKHKNTNKAKVPPFPDVEKDVRRGGPLDVNICPTEADARKIAAEACRLLNKFPGEIEDTDFPDEIDTNTITGGDSDMRKLVELMSLLAFKSDFDFRSIRYVFRWAKKHSNGQYLLEQEPTTYPAIKGDYVMSTFYVPVLHNGESTHMSSAARSKYWFHVNLYHYQVTEEDIEALPPVPPWWGFRCVTPNSTEPTVEGRLSAESITKFVNYLSWRSFGHFGIVDSLNSDLRMLANGKADRRLLRGPFGGSPLFRKCSAERVDISKAVTDTIAGMKTAYVFHIMLPRTAKILAMQSAYETFKRTGDTLKMIEELVVALEELRIGKSMLTKESYCKCQTEEQRELEAHHCMLCANVVPCSTMAWTEDGRLVCNAHFKDRPPAPETFLKSRIVLKAKDTGKDGLTTLQDRHDIRDTLSTSYWLPDGGYQDAYNGIRQDRVVLHPLRMSLDAVYPLCKVGSKFFLHHFTNVCLTTQFLNHFKGDDIPMMLAAAADATRTSAMPSSDAKVQKLEDIELAFDHFFQIRFVLPRGVRKREVAANAAPKDWFLGYEKMMRSGIYDGSPPLLPSTYRISHDYLIKKSDKWDDETIARLNSICLEIENSEVYNPNKLKLLRGQPSASGQPGAPWIWNPAHRFDDHDWTLLEHIFSERFSVMDNTCDWVNDHSKESSETLFLVCVILYFRLDGGKDEILGLHLTVFSRHALRFSIGRALHVEPGSLMRTGWKDKYPKSLAQYDGSQRSITMEAWCMNRGKLDFPASEENVNSWKQALADAPTTSPYWGPYPPVHTSQYINLPTNWRSVSTPSTSTTDEEEEEENDEIRREPDDFADEDNEGLEQIDDVQDSDDEFDFTEDTSGPGKQTDTQSTKPASVQAMFELMHAFKDKLQASEEEKELYTGTLKNIQALLERATTDHSPDSRKDLFERAVGKMITIHNENSYMSINSLAEVSLEFWQELEPAIVTAFTVEDIVSFCTDLDRKDNLTYIPSEGAFIYKP